MKISVFKWQKHLDCHATMLANYLAYMLHYHSASGSGIDKKES